MTVRHGTPPDIDSIMAIFEAAKQYMRKTGNTSQWSDGYPARENILADIANGHNYVIIDNNGHITATFALILGEDPTYLYIEDGAWPDNEPYGTIHRIASAGRTPGMLKHAVEFAFTLTNNIRIDTHRDNRPMLDALSRLGFKHCGTIYCRDGSPRLAFQLKRQ